MMPAKLFTVGHSNHSMEVFLGLLGRHGIRTLADVRSHPYSTYVPCYNREVMEQALARAGIHYFFKGDALGGRPQGGNFYDTDGRVLYDRAAETPEFIAGIAWLKCRIQSEVTAIMCSEEDPHRCHRQRLVGRVMMEENVEVVHIRGHGGLETTDAPMLKNEEQRSLFDFREDPSWKSLRSASPKNPRKRSLASSIGMKSSD